MTPVTEWEKQGKPSLPCEGCGKPTSDHVMVTSRHVGFSKIGDALVVASAPDFAFSICDECGTRSALSSLGEVGGKQKEFLENLTGMWNVVRKLVAPEIKES